MKSCCFVFLISISIWAKAQSTSAEMDSKSMALLKWKSGTINFVVQGDASGKASYSFDEYGWRVIMARKFEYELYGLKSEINRSDLTDGDFSYEIDHPTQKGKKKTDRTMSSLRKYKSAKETREAMLVSMGGKQVGSGTILGKPCDVWKLEKGAIKEVWIWQGLPLKSIRKISTLTVEYIAQDITLDGGVTPEAFILPDGIQWQ